MSKPSQNETDSADKDLLDRFFWRCQRLILARPRSEYEIVGYMDRKTRNLDPVSRKRLKDLVVNELKSQNLINDREFIKWWVEGRNYFKPRGRALLKLELIKKGIDKNLIDSTLPELLEDELVQAEKALFKKTKSLERLDRKTKFNKTINYLQRKGFSYTTSKKAFDNLFFKE